MSTTRVDYVKVAMNVESDRVFKLAGEWYNLFDPSHDTEGARRSAHVNSVRSNPDGTRLYIFEAWGIAADKVRELDYGTWAPHLDRLDIRQETDVTPDGIQALYTHLQQNKAGSRNVTLYDSKIRSGRGGRGTGGTGMAIGSHKSDWRASFYKRGGERGAMEFQCAGSLLQSRVKTYTSIFNAQPPVTTMNTWDMLIQSLLAYSSIELDAIAGMPSYYIKDVLAGNLHPAESTDRTLETIDSLVGKLPPDAIPALLESLQLRLL